MTPTQKTQARDAQLAAFLAGTDWNGAAQTPLAGDASNRKYHRLSDTALGAAVLMDAPPPTEDVRPFILIAQHLSGIGLSAPQIFAADPEQGFLILEDLGDDLFARVLATDPAQEIILYRNAIDALITAQSAPPPSGLKTYGPVEMADAACLALDWYVTFADAPVTQTQRDNFKRMIRTALDRIFDTPLVLTQRDYHAENLLWLPTRAGPARAGLLDFQDAMLCHPAYDLASLLVDARRDVSAETRTKMMAYFAEKTGAGDITHAFHTLSAQRNLRILGVFTRLSVRDNRRNYPDMIPRVWRSLQIDLDRAGLSFDLPAPTDAVIAKLKTAHV